MTAAASQKHNTKAVARKSNVESGESRSAGRAHVLVVEDEHDLQELLRYNLEREGMKVTCADTGEQAMRMVREAPPEVVLLDLMLPGVDGLEVCRSIRADAVLNNIPIVMLTAKDEEADVVIGLELGADDYITKPFSPRVLIARLKAVLRRRAQEQEHEEASDDSIIRIGELAIDPQRHEVRVEEEDIRLTPTEFRLLHLLAKRPGRVFSRQQIIEAIHGGYTAVTDRSVDVQIVTLRRKLGVSGQRIETVRGVGYRFKDD